MKQSFQNTRYRAILLLTGLMLAMTTMAQTLTNDALDLSGMWRFQLDPMGFGKTPGRNSIWTSSLKPLCSPDRQTREVKELKIRHAM
jgi:hypothetical protein